MAVEPEQGGNGHVATPPSAEMRDRIRVRLSRLAEIGPDPRGGVTRLAYTEEERAAHQLFAEFVAEDGKECAVDAAGNSIATYRDGVPYFLAGSHLDTVVQGGAYDGAAGVISALEAAREVAEATEHGVRVVAFAGEEGARFGRPNLGSALAAGLLEPEALGRLTDADDITLAEAAEALGFPGPATDVWLGSEILCFIELHIEQGRQLESRAARIGLVDAIAGSVRLRFEFRGRSDHSGATPMSMRSDALVAASELVLDAERIGRQYRSTVATVGKVEVQPNNVTTVPGVARVWLDVRDVDADHQRLAARSIFERARAIGEERGITIAGEVISDQPPVVLDAWPRAIAHQECAARGLPYRVLSSGAGHDAAIVARRAPATMLFVPCVEGISHSPAELASVDDIAAATDIIAAMVRRGDRLATVGGFRRRPRRASAHLPDPAP